MRFLCRITFEKKLKMLLLKATCSIYCVNPVDARVFFILNRECCPAGHFRLPGSNFLTNNSEFYLFRIHWRFLTKRYSVFNSFMYLQKKICIIASIIIICRCCIFN